MSHPYPPLGIEVRTPRLSLLAATDDRLLELLPVVRDGVVGPDDSPFDDPMSLYDDNPQRERRWLRAVWAGRGRVSDSFWRLYFVVQVDGELVGVQDVIGLDFAAHRRFTTFSWLAPRARGRGLGKEMRSAVLHLGFEGLSGAFAESEAFEDNQASNAVSQALYYERNGQNFATRHGESAVLLRWLINREQWAATRRSDIELVGVDAALPVLGIS